MVSTSSQFPWYFNSNQQTFVGTSSALVPELGSGDAERNQSWSLTRKPSVKWEMQACLQEYR